MLTGVSIIGGARARRPSWTVETPLSAPRSYAQGVRLVTGEVLIVGGMERDNGIVMRRRAELFDPIAGATSVVPQDLVGRMWHTLTTLDDGRVLVAGGVERVGDGFDTLSQVDLFDPHTRAWHRAAPLRRPRSDHAATLLHDGRVLVAGGHDGPQPLASVEIYDPRTDEWTTVAPMPTQRWTFSMATLPSGLVLVAGGFEQPGLQSDSSLFYKPSDDTWHNAPSLLSERANHTTVVLRNGEVMLIGGQREGSNTAERYDLLRGRWVPAGTLVQPRMFAQAVERADGTVVLVGGIVRPDPTDAFTPNALVEVWDPATNLWTVFDTAPTARAGGVVAFVGGAVCLFGGSAQDDQPIRSVECLR